VRTGSYRRPCVLMRMRPTTWPRSASSSCILRNAEKVFEVEVRHHGWPRSDAGQCLRASPVAGQRAGRSAGTDAANAEEKSCSPADRVARVRARKKSSRSDNSRRCGRR
jgi:hypothetical protein